MDLKVPVRYLFDDATCTSEQLPKEIISHLLVHKRLICCVPLRKFTLVGSIICPQISHFFSLLNYLILRQEILLPIRVVSLCTAVHRYTISLLLADLLHCACKKARKLEFSEETPSSYALELGNNGIATVKRLSFIEKVFSFQLKSLHSSTFCLIGWFSESKNHVQPKKVPVSYIVHRHMSFFQKITNIRFD